VRILASGIVGAQNGTWNQKGDILFFPQTSTGAIHKDSGGTTSEVTKLDTQAGERSHRFPQFLPDGKRFLFFAYMKDNTTNGRVNLGELGSLEHKTVLEGGSAAIFARTPDGDGYLIFAKGNTLMGQRFDESAGKVLGEAVTIADNVGGSGNLGMMPNVAASATGLLVYSSASGSAGSARFTWFDRNGKKLSDLPPEVSGSQPTISPDEKLLAAVRDDPVRRSPDIWITDLVRGVPSRLTFGPLDVQNPVWSSDSKQVAFHTHGAKGQGEIHRKDATGAGTENTVAESLAGVLDWSPDGRYLLIAADGSLLLQPTAGGPTVEVMKGTGMFANNTGQARFSRDGKYIAYASSESGQFEIYVTPVPPAKGKWQVSSKGGYQPSWRRDNKEIYYIAPDQNLMAVDVKSGEAFQPGTSQALFRTSSAYTLVTRNTYDVSGDGQKFLFPMPSAEERVTPLTVVMNWWAGIKK
jgi:Tol biopolymer transport system component